MTTTLFLSETTQKKNNNTFVYKSSKRSSKNRASRANNNQIMSVELRKNMELSTNLNYSNESSLRRSSSKRREAASMISRRMSLPGLSLLLLSLLSLTCHSVAAPLDHSLQDTLKDDTLLLLVPSVPIQRRSDTVEGGAEAPSAAPEEDVEYDLIAIPGEVLRREIRQTGHKYGPLEKELDVAEQLALQKHEASLKENNHDKRSFWPFNDGEDNMATEEQGSFDFSSFKSSGGDTSGDNDQQMKDVLAEVGRLLSGNKGQGVSTMAATLQGGLGGGRDQEQSKFKGAVESIKGIKQKLKNKFNLPGAETSQEQNQNDVVGDLGGLGGVLELGGAGLGGLSAVLAKFGGEGSSGRSVDSVGGAGGLFGALHNIKNSGGGEPGAPKEGGGLGGIIETVSGGFRYAGRLTTALLRILLQLPGIKARVFTEVIQASGPLTTAVSDVISENADDMRSVVEASTSLITDAVDLVVRMVSDVLALKGRMLASIGGDGFNKAAGLFDGGLRVGAATVQAATDAASAVGRGVGEVSEVVSEADLPPLPALPDIGALFGR